MYLVRHAHAIDEAPGVPDGARHLTAQGRAAARQLGERLSWYDCAPTAVWTSPAVRAVQTAELLLAGLGWSGVIEGVHDLAPGGDLRAIRARLREGAPDAQVMAVGHEPGISSLGALLTGRRDFPALRKGQVARLEDVAALRGEGPGPMTLRWVFAWGDEAPIPAV